MTQATYKTVFGSLDHYEKGGVQVIDDDVRHYAFSNCFEIASGSRPYEKVVFGQNQIYVLEAIRAEGTSPWYTCAHDEFALCMDGEVTVDFIRMNDPPSADKNGAILVGDAPEGQRMGHVKLKRGHQVLLGAGNAYRFTATRTGVVMQQTVLGDLSVQKWREICLA